MRHNHQIIRNMTRNQILKSIATAQKAIEKATKNVAMYTTRRDNAIAKANAKGIQVSTTDFHVVNPNAQRPTVEMNIRGSFDFNIVYPIMNAWESALENAATEARENRRIAHLNDELAAMDAAENHVNDMATIMENAMAEFKAQWFAKMMDWHMAHHAHINSILADTIRRRDRMNAIEKRMERQCGFWMCRTQRETLKKNHGRIYLALNQAIRNANEIIFDKAAGKTKSEYRTMAMEMISAEWSRNMKVLVEKLDRFNINTNAVKVDGIGTTAKGFECFITDGNHRTIYARMIWAAEYSMMVSPHTRYIVTEKH